MPRTGDSRPRSGGGDHERRDSRGPRPPRVGSDEEVLRLRDEGRSYAGVARSLSLKRSNDAHAAFLRALRQRPPDEQARLIDRERGRLDQLEARIRDRDKDDPARLDRRLAALQSLRNSVA